MTRGDYLLLVLKFSKAQGLTPVQLQKSLFLLSQELSEAVGEEFYKFEPYNYGPFDVTIYHDAEELEKKGLLSIKRGGPWAEYILTDQGKEYTDKLQIPEDVRNYTRKVVEWTQSLSFQELVRAIYKKYPNFQLNSVFQG